MLVNQGRKEMEEKRSTLLGLFWLGDDNLTSHFTKQFLFEDTLGNSETLA